MNLGRFSRVTPPGLIENSIIKQIGESKTVFLAFFGLLIRITPNIALYPETKMTSSIFLSETTI